MEIARRPSNPYPHCKTWPNGGYLYAIAATAVARVKVGIANDPGVRLSTLRPGSPVPLRLHSVTWHRDPLAVERAAHLHLAHARLHGEWFDARDGTVGQWLAGRPRFEPGAPMGVTAREAAEWAQVDESTIRDWIRSGRLLSTSYRSAVYIEPLDLERARRQFTRAAA